MNPKFLQSRQPPQKTIFKQIKMDDNRTKIGFGSAANLEKIRSAPSLREGLAAVGLANVFKDAIAAAPYTMDTVHQTRWTLSGPITDNAIEKNFSNEIDLFGNSKSVEGVSYVESTMPQNGELNAHMMACSIGFHIEPEPVSWTAQGNAWYHTAGGQVRKPPSPDVFTIADLATGALGAAFEGGADADEMLIPAVLEWGHWANYCAWHLVRGYGLDWSIGTKHNIISEVLRHTAYMPPAAQDGSSGSSQTDILAAVRRTNDYYRRNGSVADFLKIDCLRLGVLNILAGAGDFRPSRAYELAGVTYGGGDLRAMLRGNSEFRKLNVPYIIGAGIPIGLKLDQVDETQAALMRDYLSITQGRQGDTHTPPQIVDSAFVSSSLYTGTAASPVMAEQSIDCLSTCSVFFEQLYSQRVLYKMGDLKLSLLIKGFELDGQLYQDLLTNVDMREALCNECECKMVM